jgi:hypothetical protein
LLLKHKDQMPSFLLPSRIKQNKSYLAQSMINMTMNDHCDPSSTRLG